MTEKRFELYVNKRNQYDIVDWVESKEKNATCIYNDLGHYYFSSAKALCDLLNELHEKNKELKRENDTLIKQRLGEERLKQEIADYHTSNGRLRRLNNELNEENENITLLAQHNYEESKSIINRYIDKIKILERTNEQLRDLILHMGYTIKDENGTITLELKQ